MKEMVGGCCVCSDESGWDENPLVYCDGHGCDVAVHQACYGIVSVPVGPWFCRKCESQERSSITRCELCPGKGGALKPTDSGGWAHVVCALYIPEVRFGDVATMEPVLLSQLPPDRFSKPCCLCELAGRTSRATTGATMRCNKPGCRQNFHVTCAQSQGLLCEEQVQSMNVTYCGYCPHHYGKLKRGHNLRPIAAFKASHDPATPDASPEKQPPPGEAAARAERRPKKPRAAAASPVLLPAAVEDGPPPPEEEEEKAAAVKEEPGAAGVRFTAATFSEALLTPAGAALFAGQLAGEAARQQAAPDSASADGKDAGVTVKQETEPPEQRLLAAAGAAGQVASLPVATSTALPGTQAEGVDSAALKRPAAAAAENETRKRRPAARARKQAGGGGSPEPGAAGVWTGATGATGAGAAAGAATARSGAAAVAPGLTAPHMIGNHLNPSAPLGESLAAEMAEQADYLEPTGPLQGLAGRTAVTPQWRPDTAAAPFPRSLTELLERQWQQGSHFLMEQSHHMDIAALLSCLYQLRQENEQLEQHMGVVSQRREHLLAVHARLSVPLESAAPGVVLARAAAVRHQAAADAADLNGGIGPRATPPRPSPQQNGLSPDAGQPDAPAPAAAAAPAAPAPANTARPQTNGRTG